jgi:hypothetical protein
MIYRVVGSLPHIHEASEEGVEAIVAVPAVPFSIAAFISGETDATIGADLNALLLAMIFSLCLDYIKKTRTVS